MDFYGLGFTEGEEFLSGRKAFPSYWVTGLLGWVYFIIGLQYLALVAFGVSNRTVHATTGTVSAREAG